MRMAVIQNAVRLQTLIKYSNPLRLQNINIVKSYSIYPPSYKWPIFSKKEQAVLETTEQKDELAHTLIRPALGYQTSSEFYDPVVHKFTNYLMRNGNKLLARSLLEYTFEKIKRTQLERYHKAKPENRSEIILNPTDVLHKAIENVKPIMELQSIKKGGATYQVPVPILERRQMFLAMNWLLQAGKDKTPEIRYHDVLAKDLIDASNNQGRVVKKKQDLHKQCETNRAYAHYRWA